MSQQSRRWRVRRAAVTIALGSLVVATVAVPAAQAATSASNSGTSTSGSGSSGSGGSNSGSGSSGSGGSNSGSGSTTTVTPTASPTPVATVAPAPVATATPTAAATVTPAPAASSPAPVAAAPSCKNDPQAPWRLGAVRDPNDPTTITIDWADVACATRYNVSVFVDGKDTVTVVDGATNSFKVPSSDTTKTYQIQIGSRNDAGRGAATPVFYLRPSVPGGVTGMKIDYTDVSAAALTWNAPVDRAPISYQLVVTRVADHKVIIDTPLDGKATSAPLPGMDARGIFTITLQPTNKSGLGPTSRLVIGEEKPNPVKSIGAIRDPNNPKMVIVSWLPSDNTLRGAVLGYEIGYGKHSADSRVIVKQTEGTVSIPADQSTVVIVRVITDRGRSRWSKSIRVPIDGNRLTGTTNASVDLVEQDGVVTIAETNSLAKNQLVVKITPTLANGGFTDTQYSQVGANHLSFRTVPQGSYVVTVMDAGKELARRYLNIGNVGFMAPTDWKVVRGSADITMGTVDMSKSGESQVLSLRPRTTQDVVVETDAQLTVGDGYGFWFRTSNLENSKPTGLTFQYDPKYSSSFIIRDWQNGTECSKPIAVTPFPAGLVVNGTHRIVMAAQGDTLYATLDGVKLFELPSIAKAVAGNACGYAAPTGTQVGLRKWTTSAVVFKNTSIL